MEPEIKNPPSEPAGSDDFYRRLCSGAAIAMVATDAEFNIVCWNQAACRLLAKPAEEMIGKPISHFVPPNRRKLLERLLLRTTNRKEPSQFEVRLPISDPQSGHETFLMVVLSPILSHCGGVEGISAWIVDETESKRLAHRLLKTQKMTSLGTLAGGIAHHFNNILGGLATFVDFALTSGKPAEMRRALQMAAEASTRASKITQSLLSFAEQDDRTDDLADLTEIILTFTHLVERALHERNIQLELDLKPVPVVAVSSSKMHKVLGILLGNAEEAITGSGTIRIGLEQGKGNGNGKKVLLTFADSGTGIKPEHLTMVFEPFFTTKGLHAGGQRSNPGLGLSVAHGIIEEMQGRIEVESPPNQGSKFTITLPVAISN